jgi:hypothetical protein
VAPVVLLVAQAPQAPPLQRLLTGSQKAALSSAAISLQLAAMVAMVALLVTAVLAMRPMARLLQALALLVVSVVLARPVKLVALSWCSMARATWPSKLTAQR